MYDLLRLCLKVCYALIRARICYELLSLLFAGCFIATPFINARADQSPDLVDTEKLTIRNPDSAFVLIQGLIKKFQNSGDNSPQGISSQQLGSVLHYQGAYQQALVYYHIV